MELNSTRIITTISAVSASTRQQHCLLTSTKMKVIFLLIATIAIVHANDDSTSMERSKLSKFFFPSKTDKDDYENSYNAPMKPMKKPMKPFTKPMKRPYKRPGYNNYNKVTKTTTIPPLPSLPPINIIMNLPAVPAVAATTPVPSTTQYAYGYPYTTPSAYPAPSYAAPAPSYAAPAPSYPAPAPSYPAPAPSYPASSSIVFQHLLCTVAQS
ncbi:SH3 domain-containing protein C23A1.17 [Daphnia magna]|uniref:SH3 domain-containing protein C23A1.17 n=1 Tax=Daphnia magna TaxID=35525 RepID=UPI001E1BC5BE|nr:SH3 domain-containing protein C23A1.17 [Daphnia magna]